jgi:hypothetical protein
LSEPVSAGKSGNFAGKKTYPRGYISGYINRHVYIHVYTRGEGNCFVLSKNRVYAKIMNIHNIMQFFWYFVMHVILRGILF